jgi:hypothetical protein
MSEPIEIKLVETNFLTRWHCHVCGGHTEKVPILAEGGDARGTIRVGERCLETGDLDARLEEHAKWLDEEAARTRTMIGRLRVPSFAQWKARDRLHEIEWLYDNDCIDEKQAKHLVENADEPLPDLRDLSDPLTNYVPEPDADPIPF